MAEDSLWISVENPGPWKGSVTNEGEVVEAKVDEKEVDEVEEEEVAEEGVNETEVQEADGVLDPSIAASMV